MLSVLSTHNRVAGAWIDPPFSGLPQGDAKDACGLGLWKQFAHAAYCSAPEGLRPKCFGPQVASSVSRRASECFKDSVALSSLCGLHV